MMSSEHTSKTNRLSHLKQILAHSSGARPNPRPAQLLAHVYLGDINHAESLQTLRSLGVTHVLNCAGYKGPRTYKGTPYPGLDIDYVEMFAEDVEGYEITQHFPAAFRYLNSVKRGGGVALVHCAMGINRSAAVCAGYLMETAGMSILQVVKLLKEKRHVTLTNASFVKQLFDYAEERACLGTAYQWENSMTRGHMFDPLGYTHPYNPNRGAAAAFKVTY